jgi:hypothetical protein
LDIVTGRASASRLARSLPLRLALGVLIAAALGLSGCGSRSGATSTSDTPVVIVSPRRTTGPFVVVAVNYHFHDIHPEDQNLISQNRPFIVQNDTDNLHNFTVAGTTISFDIPPEGEVEWSRVGDHLKPGFYRVFCKYHADRGMVGSFTVTP